MNNAESSIEAARSAKKLAAIEGLCSPITKEYFDELGDRGISGKKELLINCLSYIKIIEECIQVYSKDFVKIDWNSLIKSFENLEGKALVNHLESFLKDQDNILAWIETIEGEINVRYVKTFLNYLKSIKEFYKDKNSLTLELTLKSKISEYFKTETFQKLKSIKF